MVKDGNSGPVDRVAIVTGGSRGIGLGISTALAQAGHRVAVVYRADEAAADEALNALRGKGSDVMKVKADVGSRTEVESMARTVFEKWGRLDILVNNAGVFDFAFIEEMNDEFFDHIFQTNMMGVVYCVQAVIPYMKKNHFGRIVNASSISGRLADVGLVAYGASKAGVDMLTRITAAELAPYGITVNGFAPGIIETDMTAAMIEERGHLQVKQIPADRFGSAEDVAGLVRFLCSDEAAYITGEIIGVDGGMMKTQNPYRAHEYAKEHR